MSLRAAFQMDALEGINIAGDSSFALILEAKARGHEVWHYDVNALTWRDGRLKALAHPIEMAQRVKGDHFRVGEAHTIDLGSDVDIVWMRQDPPFDLSYITATHLLERIQNETLVVNDPASVRNAPEKLFVLDYARFMPPTMITRSLDEVRSFLAEHGSIVVKPLHGNGGKAIFKVDDKVDGGATNLSALMEMFNAMWVEPHMVQAFLPAVTKGDKRIVLVDGEVAGAINRLPGEGEIRSNLAMGGSAQKTELTPREEEICATMGPELKKRGLLFVGIDVIGGEWLTEINVTSPTGIVAIDAFNGTNTAGMIWDAIERKLSA